VTQTPAQFFEIQKTNLDAVSAYGHALFNGAERMTQLQLSVGRAFLRDSIDTIQSLSAAKDPREWFALAQTAAQPASEEVVNYARSVYSVTSGIGTELSKITEAHVGEVNRRAAELIDAAAKNAPAGSETAVAWIKNAVAASNNAFDTVNKATRQAVEATEQNLAAVAAAAESIKPKMRKAA
jgi:phasin family protein